MVGDASAVFLAHRSLAAQADAAAGRRAGRDWQAYYAGSGDLLPLAGEGDLHAHLVTGTVVTDVRTDGGSVAVRVNVRTERHLDLPVAPPGYGRRATVTAGATARLLRHR